MGLIGVAAFVIYALAVWLTLRAQHRTPDFSGIQEGAYNLAPTKLDRALHALLMPATLFLFALPVSLALPLAGPEASRGTRGIRIARSSWPWGGRFSSPG